MYRRWSLKLEVVISATDNSKGFSVWTFFPSLLERAAKLGTNQGHESRHHLNHSGLRIRSCEWVFGKSILMTYENTGPHLMSDVTHHFFFTTFHCLVPCGQTRKGRTHLAQWRSIQPITCLPSSAILSLHLTHTCWHSILWPSVVTA